MNVIPMPEEEYLTKAFVLAEESLKLDNVSLRKAMYTAKKGTRWSTYHAYLRKAWNRKNLHILMNTLVAKVSIILILCITQERRESSISHLFFFFREHPPLSLYQKIIFKSYYRK